QIQANVDEADVGRVREGMEATFIVNAYPGRTFSGTVKQVRLGSQTVQNVVIYTTVIEVDNPDLDLRPGMTANLRIVTERRQDVVRVPNAALRWRPPVAVEPPPPVAAPVQREAISGDESAAGPFAGGGGPGGGGGRGGFQPGVFADRIKVALALDESQKQALDKIVAELPAGNGRGRGRGLLVEKINGMLTETQRASFERLLHDWSRGGGRRRQEARANEGITGRVYRIGEQGRPQLVTVRLGSSDGAFTEVLSGLSAGTTVITGGGPAPAARTGGFRFGM
ncbi:MAG: efflux RND transporter periplasmic adaptor subunit, partial [Proteobacteria bacterium]|nr:efflux RND transporter periplasmic adaptor subunit [Pseudomonadota bacterium]